MRLPAVNRFLAQIALAAFVIAILVGFLKFDAPSTPPTAEFAGSSGAVVFTGAYERIDAGLELLADGTADRLFISGANPRAGIRPQRFVALFGPRHPKLREMLDCCIEFGPLADTTLQNALETRCWLEREQVDGPIVVVTSDHHMLRALAALRAFVPDRELIPLSVRQQEKDWEGTLREFLKYVATLVVVQMPASWLASHGLFGPFEDGCPRPQDR